MAPKGSRKGNDTLTNTTYKVGDKVRVLNAARILYGSQYFSDGDIAIVQDVRSNGERPTLAVTTSDGGKGGLYIMGRELPFIEKVVEASAHGYKVGDKMRILNAGRISGGARLTNGQVYEVAAISHYGNPRITTNGTTQLPIVESELPYVEKVVSEVVPQPIEISTMPTRISQLESQVAKLESKVHALETGNVDFFTPAVVRASSPSNPQRAAVIEQAKQFVEEVTARMYGGRINHEGNATFRHRTTKPYFTTKGRTVTVVVRGSGVPVEYERASATCAEGDVFNEDIGRAIALGRAMGLTVPTAFTKAPQPTQVVVGMEVTTLYHDGNVNKWCPTTVTNVRSGGIPGFGNGSHSSLYKIAEDTNAEYEMGAF